MAGESLGDLVDVADAFQGQQSVHFVAEDLVRFDQETGKGAIRWLRHERRQSLNFNKVDTPLSRSAATEFPDTEYDRDPVLPFELTLVSDRTIRLRFNARDAALPAGDSLMLVGPVAAGGEWTVESDDEEIVMKSAKATLRMTLRPWRVTLEDAEGRVLTATRRLGEPASFSAPPGFSFVRNGADLSRSFAAATSLSPGERLFGCGESFTRLDKRGQRIIAMTRDAMGVQSQRMYKPIPFYLSSNGYGVFVHTSTPTTFDFGRDFDGTNVAYVGDEQLDLFFFVGDPAEVLEEYTALTGRSPAPPVWSFGLWMSRITYKSEAEVRDVAAKLREHAIPCDVIHLDTGWFETDWQCDYQFSASRFDDPRGMIADLIDDGFRVCLWQLPYFTAKNRLFDEAQDDGLFVKNRGGKMPAEDGVLDFTNPDTVAWYQGKLTELLKLGVGAIKVDFGEDAPLEGVYASGRTGWYERNLYPLLYNRVVSDLTEAITGERIIWARSAWAGSQRYPLHWGGDAENTYSAMAATLRGGLSLGLCGFTYWSHDAGGFVERAPRELYVRWLAMAAFGSHTRCHGAPPREPWEYDEAFVGTFRQIMETRYRLIPYLVAQSRTAAERGAPLIRPLFFAYPHDPTSWLIEDQYLLGEDFLIAPLLDDGLQRDVYLPPGDWIDYQTGGTFEGRAWHTMTAAELPIIVLVRNGSLVPHAPLAQHTGAIAWDQLELVHYGDSTADASTRVFFPEGRDTILTAHLSGQGDWRLSPQESDGGSDYAVRTTTPGFDHRGEDE
ncbi:glycoside hydrolase family 31 protein [Botrimarina colliarenosi]|uniref:glycoside hydrolase family 31 protein n=1 Tax=Botrimarina colliarenosi TaxID=2528001 RepID=UPI0018D42107|nr:TIM-barrel domain-containing protein [Botrimarina colliarenosi]